MSHGCSLTGSPFIHDENDVIMRDLVLCAFTVFISVLWIWIRMDQHRFGSLDLVPH
jgi:hypothetical protein